VPERKGRAAGNVEPRESGGHRRQPALEPGYASEQGGERLGLGWTALLARITHAAKPFPHGYAAVNGPGRIEPATLDGATFRADARIPKRGDTKRRRLGADSENENGHEHRRQGAQRGEVLAPRH
jgi:hypothetical protein